MIDESGSRRSTIDPLTIRTREDFAGALGRLRSDAGVSIRRLGQLVDTPPTTIHGWFQGKHLPYPRDNDLFVRVLQALSVEDVAAWRKTLDVIRRPEAEPRPVPYVGLRSYGPDDADLFFGREALVHKAMKAFDEMTAGTVVPRIMFLVGPSGAGKSSVLRAGIEPSLASAGRRVVAIRWAELAVALTKGTLEPTSCLLIDQFEELFTAIEPPDRKALVESLAALCSSPAGISAVAALRADFYGDVAAISRLTPALETRQVVVGPMAWDDLRSCVLSPAKHVGLDVDDELVEIIRRDVAPSFEIGDEARTAGALPLLSHALARAAAVSTGNRLTASDYLRVGGISGAVEQAAETAYEQLNDPGRDAVRRLAPLLVNIERSGTLTRRLVSDQELDQLSDQASGETVDDAILAFADARIFTTTSDGVELAHEAVLTAWPRLRTWVDEDRAGLAARAEIADAAQVWSENGEHPSTLLGETRLGRLTEATAHGTPILGPAELRYLDASRSQIDNERRRERRRRSRLRALAATATVLALLAGGFAVAANGSAADARAARDREFSRQLALRSGILRPTDPVLAAQLALSAFQASPTYEARSALVESTAAPRSSRLLGGPGATALAASLDGSLIAIGNSADGSIQLASAIDGHLERQVKLTDLDHETDVYAIALSDDGKLLAAGGTDKAVSLWDLTTPHQPKFMGKIVDGLAGAVFGLSFSPVDDQLFVVAGDAVSRFHVIVGQPAENLDPLDLTAGRAIAVSSDGKRIAGVSDDGTVRFWDRGAGTEPVDLNGKDGSRGTSIAFSPDGNLVAAGSKSGHVRVWDLHDPATPTELPAPETTFTSWVNAVAFSPDGRSLAAGDADRSVRLWNTGNWSVANDIQLPNGATGADFIGANELITSASDGGARLWDIDDQFDAGLDSTIWTAAFDAAGDRYAAFGDTIGIWDTTDPTHLDALSTTIAPSGTDQFSGAGDISPNGKLVAAGGGSGELELIDVTDPANAKQLGTTIHDSDQLIENVRFSHSGKTLAVGGDDGIVRLYDITDPATPKLYPHQIVSGANIVLTLAISPDDRWLAIASNDAKAHLIDISDPTNPHELAALTGYNSDVNGLAITPDGHTLATSSADEQILFWDVTDPAHPSEIGNPLPGPHGTEFSLAYSRDGRYLAASITDHSVWVWDVGNPTRPSVYLDLESPSAPMHTADFDSSGRYLIGGGADTFVRAWTVDPGQASDQVCTFSGDPISTKEWASFIVSRPYRPPCG